MARRRGLLFLRGVVDRCLFDQRSLWFFLTERLHSIDKAWFFKIIFYCTIDWKRWGMRIFPKIVLIAKRHSLKVTSPTFLFREVEQLAFYQLLPKLTIWGYFGWLSCGSEPVSMWGTLQDLHTKSRAFVTTVIFRVFISID